MVVSITEIFAIEEMRDVYKASLAIDRHTHGGRAERDGIDDGSGVLVDHDQLAGAKAVHEYASVFQGYDAGWFITHSSIVWFQRTLSRYQ